MLIPRPMYLLLLLLLSMTGPDRRLSVKDFVLQGDTERTSSNCLRLTDNQIYKSGSIWYKESINLNKAFLYEFSLMLGCNDAGGADGMVFVMTSHANRTGYVGEGIGFGGLVPSIGIEIDTWRNNHLNDPEEDHIALLINGRVGHYHSLTEPNLIKNLEDCKRHRFVVRWDPITRTTGSGH